MDWRGRIISEPGILVGKPTIKGTRISVELILGWLANGWSMEGILTAYPHITRDEVQAALAFAAEMLREAEYTSGSDELDGGLSRQGASGAKHSRKRSGEA